MKLSPLLLSTGAGAIAFALLPSSAFAQSNSPRAAATETANADIIVTAQKREESILTVPGSVTAVQQRDLIARGATSLIDLAAYVPGLNIGTGVGLTSVIIRGINTGLDASAASGVIVDGAPIGSSSAFGLGGSAQFDLDPSDIKRIEVLRGPQGTLYGASTLGGLVSYVTRPASLTDFGVSAGGEVATTEGGKASYTVRGAVDVPVVNERFGVRVSAFNEVRGGFIDNTVTKVNDFNRSERYGGRLDFHFKPADTVDIDLWGGYQKTNRNGEDFYIANADGSPRDGALQYNDYVVPTRNQEIKIVHGAVNVDVGFADLAYIGTYQKSSFNGYGNYTTAAGTFKLLGTLGLGPVFPAPGVAGIGFSVDLEKNSHEIRLSSNSTGPVSWIVGGFFTYEKAGQTQTGQGLTAAGVPIAALNPFVQFRLNSTYKEYAAFANLTYAITPKFSVTGGIRIGEDEQNYQQLASGTSLAGLNALLTSIFGPAAAFSAATVPAQSKETIKTYLADAKYQFSPNAQLYARFATGYRPGGPNVQSVGTPATFASDEVKSYEIGFKGQTVDRKLRVELAAFYVDWSNIQVTGSNNGFGFRTNGGKASSRGVEATVNLMPVPGLNVGGVFAYTDAHLNEAIAAVGGANGETLPLTPKFSATGTIDYAWPLGNSLRGIVGGVVRLVSDRQTTFVASAASPNIRLDGYATADFRLGIQTDRFEVAGFVRNLTDTRAAISGRNAFSVNEVAVNRPRTFGLMASVRY